MENILENPGDAGLPIKLSGQVMKKLKNMKFYILFPKTFDHGVLTIGYENEVIFPIKIEFDPKIRFFESTLNIEYLVCNEICIPVSTQRKIKIRFKNDFKNLKDSVVYKYQSEFLH